MIIFQNKTSLTIGAMHSRFDFVQYEGFFANYLKWKQKFMNYMTVQ